MAFSFFNIFEVDTLAMLYVPVLGVRHRTTSSVPTINYPDHAIVHSRNKI